MLFKSTTLQAEARSRIVNVHGQDYVLREYVGNSPTRGVYVEGNEANDNQLPQGFLVTQPPNSVTRPHFHETNQFQVFVGGSCQFGKKSANPLSVQFAGGHTPYGPISAGAQGVTYFTLRQRWDPGAKYMPAMREKLVRGRQRQRFALEVADEAAAQAMVSAGVTKRDLITSEPDGLLACLMRLEPGATAAVPAPDQGGGQYLVVLEGSLIDQGEDMPRWSCVYLTPEEPAYEAAAGSKGLDLLVLRFPRVAD